MKEYANNFEIMPQERASSLEDNQIINLVGIIYVSLHFHAVYELLSACNGDLYMHVTLSLQQNTEHICVLIYHSSVINAVHSSNQNLFEL